VATFTGKIFCKFLSQLTNEEHDLSADTIDVLGTTSSWFGATYAEDKPIVQRSIRALVEAGEYPSCLWSG
jgi:hypothetical protein